jgi:hypothetical protein
VDFSPRGASAPLFGSEAEASRGLKPAPHNLVAATPRFGAGCQSAQNRRGTQRFLWSVVSDQLSVIGMRELKTEN